MSKPRCEAMLGYHCDLNPRWWRSHECGLDEEHNGGHECGCGQRWGAEVDE